jgi:sulfonate dioxygenase
MTDHLCGEVALIRSALLVAQKGVVFFRGQQDMTIESQRDLGAHFGPLHKHATYAVPRRGDLDDVVGESSRAHGDV